MSERVRIFDSRKKDFCRRGMEKKKINLDNLCLCGILYIDRERYGRP